jgi:hypothetical protein
MAVRQINCRAVSRCLWCARAVAEEINISDAIKLLREAVSSVSDAFSKVEPKEVEDIFGGSIFFETVLGIEEEKEIPIQHLRDAAAYLLVNQILFYQILAKEKKDIIRYKETRVRKTSEALRTI